MSTITVVSTCCGMSVSVNSHGLTLYYVCDHCGQATDGVSTGQPVTDAVKQEREINYWRHKIPTMTHTEMAHLYRFAPPGHFVFRSDLPLVALFKARFASMGGMTPAVSKKIGLG
jgi:hypothetical protein